MGGDVGINFGHVCANNDVEKGNARIKVSAQTRTRDLRHSHGKKIVLSVHTFRAFSPSLSACLLLFLVHTFD